jgi:pimeloyl-ACP methyl ester carboxylesterase
MSAEAHARTVIPASTTAAIEMRHLSIHGHKLAVRTGGAGPVLLLVHGMAGSSATWRYVLPTLAQRFTVVAPDLLGHGESGKPRRSEYSLGALANVLRDLLHVLGHEHATFIGQSLGGGVALQLAYQYPEQCERLVLVGSGGLGREVSAILRGLTLPGAEYIFPLVCSPVLRDAGSAVAAWLYHLGLRAAPAVEEMWRSYASLADPDHRNAFFRTLRSVVDLGGQAVTATDRLYLASQVPTLIVWGDRDPFIPVSHAQPTHEAMPGSRLAVFEDVGHFPHCEAPQRFVDVLVDFMNSTEAARLTQARLRELLRASAPSASIAAADAAPGETAPVHA